MARPPKQRQPPPGGRTGADLLAVAIAHHRAGRAAQAQAGYERLARERARDPDVWHLWGVLAAEQGQPQTAEQRIARALQLKPGEPVFLDNLANVYLQQGRLGPAIDCLVQVVRSRGEAPELRRRLDVVCERQLDRGIELHRGGRAAQAQACYRDVLRGQPQRADAWHLLGVLAVEGGRLDEAQELVARAVAIAPDAANYRNSLGAVHQKAGRQGEAIECYRMAVQLDPGLASAHANLGRVFAGQGRRTEAQAAFGTALGLRPDDAETRVALAALLLDAGRLAEAEAECRRALQIQAGRADALVTLGQVMRRRKREAEALASFEEAAASDPGHPELLGMIARGRAKLCRWEGHARLREDLLQGVREGRRCVSPFVFLNFCDDPNLQRRCAELRVQERWPAVDGTQTASLRQRPAPHDRIRIAYVSPDFREHPVAYLVADLIEQHDRTRFEVFGVSIGADARDPWRERLRAGFDHFLDVRDEPDDSVAQRLRSLEIDIAVDLAGYTTSSRPGIFASRAAPIQVNYLGFPGTMGAGFMDYILADRWVIPEADEACYAERLVRLPESYLCSSQRPEADRVPTREEAGLPERGFVFCCFNSAYKIHPGLFDLWMQLLAKVDGSVLWLSSADDEIQRNLRRETTARGVDPARLVFAPRLPSYADHLARQRLGDLFLDTVPYNAHTTASDALWACLPVLTCRGKAFAGRVAGSVLRAVGLPELIADDLCGYEALALRLATHPDELAALKRKLEHNRQTHALFDTDRFRRHIEAAYRRMWQAWQRGEPPSGFAVEPEPA